MNWLGHIFLESLIVFHVPCVFPDEMMISGLSEEEIFLIIIVVVVVVVIILISLLAYFFHRWFITREPGELFIIYHLSMIFCPNILFAFLNLFTRHVRLSPVLSVEWYSVQQHSVEGPGAGLRGSVDISLILQTGGDWTHSMSRFRIVPSKSYFILFNIY